MFVDSVLLLFVSITVPFLIYTRRFLTISKLNWFVQIIFHIVRGNLFLELLQTSLIKVES